MIQEIYPLEAKDYRLAGSISSAIKKKARLAQLEDALIRRISIACYEAEINMIIHSMGGSVTYTQDEEEIRIVFKDRGPGIQDIPLAMKPGYSTADVIAQSMGFGAGLGLSNIQKNADTFSLDSNEQGTTLSMSFKLKGSQI